ncbi:MAG: hypothetical protein H0V63_05395 [Burkholderiaceae bacterium]|nr:hypothetical protein [Burkholderiaceae bacterium]
MSLQEIEVALSGLSAEELTRVEETLRALRSRRIDTAAELEVNPALKNGFDVFPRRNGEPVTTEVVRQLAEEGI